MYRELILESMRLDEDFLDNPLENLEDKLKSEFLNCLQNITKRFENWSTDDLFTTPIKIVDIFELPPDEDTMEFKSYPDMPFIGVDCRIGINPNFNPSSGRKGYAETQLKTLGSWLMTFSDKLFGDCTSGLRDYSKTVKKTTVLDNGFRYEVCAIDNPDLEYKDGQFEYRGGYTHEFLIKMRPIKMRNK